MLRLVPLLLACLGQGLGTPNLAAQDGAAIVFVVRHAEKGAEGDDPSLTPEGRARATALAHMLGDVGVTAVFSSQFKRTRETAAPLAAKLGLTTQVVDARDMAALIGAIRSLPAGSRAVVVSHSNLVPVIVERLSGQKTGELTEADYDRIYVVTPGAGTGAGSALYLHFGQPAPANP
jgi:broad specificity phosphatase PhoE